MIYNFFDRKAKKAHKVIEESGKVIELFPDNDNLKYNLLVKELESYIGSKEETREFCFSLMSLSIELNIRECEFLGLCSSWNLGIDSTYLIYMIVSKVYSFYE